MKKRVFCFILIVFCFSLFTLSASAKESTPSIDWSEYSLDELLGIQQDLEETIYDMQKQYAIEHGDRTITLNEEDIQIYAGQKITLEATVENTFESAPEKTILVWKSSDENVATVNNGTVNAVSEGQAVVTCCAEDNEFILAEVPVKVVMPVTGIDTPEAKVNALIVEGADDNGVQLEWTVQPENAYCKDVEFSSSNEEVASVNEKGYVSALNPGTAVITITSLDEFSANAPKKATCTVTVLQAASSIELSETDLTMNIGAIQNIVATVLPENTSNKIVTWESSDPEVATVNNGQVRAVSCGDAVISCVAADGSGASAECNVTVIQMVTGIKILDVTNPVTMNKDSEMQLSTEILPENATNPDISWSSSDESIVTVSEDGKLYAKDGGSAVITCTATDGSEKAANVTIFVPSISIDKDYYTVKEKSGLSFKIKFYGPSSDFEIIPEKTNNFNTSKEKTEDGFEIKIIPLRAGTAAITLRDKRDTKNDRKITVEVTHDAVYDKTSYPPANYSDILRNPDLHDGENVSVYGRIVQKLDASSYGIKCDWLMVASGNNLFSVWVLQSALADGNVIENDTITVYGTCNGTYSYETVRGNENTIPDIMAEHVIIGAGS